MVATVHLPEKFLMYFRSREHRFQIRPEISGNGMYHRPASLDSAPMGGKPSELLQGGEQPEALQGEG